MATDMTTSTTSIPLVPSPRPSNEPPALGSTLGLKLVMVALFWGGTFIAGRVLAQALPLVVAAFGRFLVAAILLIWAAFHIEGALPRPTRSQLLATAAMGLTGIGLDLYQAHWYDSVEATAPLAAPVADLALDRPLVLGEYPTKGSQRSPSAIVATARQAGWAAALAWSVLAQDPATDFAALDVDPTVERA